MLISPGTFRPADSSRTECALIPRHRRNSFPGSQYGEDTADPYNQGVRRGQYRSASLNILGTPSMFQLIGSLLAFFAIISVLADSPIAGTVFAITTFIWVVVANPRRRERTARNADPWGAIYEARFSR